jgi:hypothetical protein
VDSDAVQVFAVSLFLDSSVAERRQDGSRIVSAEALFFLCPTKTGIPKVGIPGAWLQVYPDHLGAFDGSLIGRLPVMVSIELCRRQQATSTGGIDP